MADRYFVKIGKAKEREVSREEFIQAERNAGFVPKAGCGDVATAGFGFSQGDIEIRGRIEADPVDGEEARWLKRRFERKDVTNAN